MNLSQVTARKALNTALSTELEPVTAANVAVVQLDLALGRDWFLRVSVSERVGSYAVTEK